MHVTSFIPMTGIQQILEEKYHLYNNPGFIASDPICIPHKYSIKENIEIAAFLTATIAWGQRPTIIRNADKLLSLMGHDPFDYIMNSAEHEILKLGSFVHRTFLGTDVIFFITALRNIYSHYGGLHKLMADKYLLKKDIRYSLMELYRVFFELPHPVRTEKHIANIQKGASAKRLNMFLRWMVRKDSSGVDFGLWTDIPASALYMPLDVHSGTVARNLGLLCRRQNDWKAVEELTQNLRKFDPLDPVKYDFALFGMGVFERNVE